MAKIDRLGWAAGISVVSYGLRIGIRASRPEEPRRLSPRRAALELFAHAVPARRRPKSTLTILGQVVDGAKAFNGVRGAADGMAEWLLKNCTG